MVLKQLGKVNKINVDFFKLREFFVQILLEFFDDLFIYYFYE